MEVHVEKRAEAMALELVQLLLNVGRGDRVLATVLEGRVGGEVAQAVSLVVDRSALADEGKDDQVIAIGFTGDRVQGLDDVRMRGRFAFPAGIGVA